MITSVLIAGEDAVKRSKLASPLRSHGYHIIEAESGARTQELLKRRQNILLALIDLEMADISGVNFVANIRSSGLKTPIIALTNKEDDERLRRAIEAGVDDFLIYPVSEARLSVSVGNLLQKYMLRRGCRRVIPDRRNAAIAVSLWETKSDVMKSFLKQTIEAAQNDKLLLICGENATGREDVARAIHEETILLKHSNADHQVSEQAQSLEPKQNKAVDEGAIAPFVIVSAVPPVKETVSDSKNDFSQILTSKSQQAHGGTLCVRDIDKLDKLRQAQLLQFIEDEQRQGHLGNRKLSAAETNDEHHYRLMVLASTDLKELVDEGSFSIGLYKKLNVQTLNVPALRDRQEDIADIAETLLARMVSETKKTTLGGISTAAQNLLREYKWPDNLAELENILFRAVLASEGRLLLARDFPQLSEEINVQPKQDAYNSEELFFDDDGHIKSLTSIEKEVIMQAMKRYRGKISEVARRLQIGRSTLYRKLEEYGLQADA